MIYISHVNQLPSGLYVAPSVQDVYYVVNRNKPRYSPTCRECKSVATTSQTWCRVIGTGSLASGAENTKWTRARSVEGSKLETRNRWSLEVVVAGHR